MDCQWRINSVIAEVVPSSVGLPVRTPANVPILSILTIVGADRTRRRRTTLGGSQRLSDQDRRSGGLGMAARYSLALIVAIGLLTSSGCCWIRRVLCDECCSPCETGAFTYFTGKSCGPTYWGDWHSHPPKCDPCDNCGRYVGRSNAGYQSEENSVAPSTYAVGTRCESCGEL